MHNKHSLLGTQSPGETLEIRKLKRVWRDEVFRTGLIDGQSANVVKERRRVQLNAWSGETTAGMPVHLAYRFGELTLEVDLPGKFGRRPLRVLRWKPHYALALAKPQRVSGDTPRDRIERAQMAEEAAQRDEISALNRKPQVITEGDVNGWLIDRVRHFEFLRQSGRAGGDLRIRLVRDEYQAPSGR